MSETVSKGMALSLPAAEIEAVVTFDQIRAFVLTNGWVKITETEGVELWRRPGDTDPILGVHLYIGAWPNSPPEDNAKETIAKLARIAGVASGEMLARIVGATVTTSIPAAHLARYRAIEDAAAAFREEFSGFCDAHFFEDEDELHRVVPQMNRAFTALVDALGKVRVAKVDVRALAPNEHRALAERLNGLEDRSRAEQAEVLAQVRGRLDVIDTLRVVEHEFVEDMSRIHALVAELAIGERDETTIATVERCLRMLTGETGLTVDSEGRFVVTANGVDHRRSAEISLALAGEVFNRQDRLGWINSASDFAERWNEKHDGPCADIGENRVAWLADAILDRDAQHALRRAFYPADRYTLLLVDLHRETEAGRGCDPGAEQIREEMAELWRAMTRDEHVAADRLSEDLYAVADLRRTRIDLDLIFELGWRAIVQRDMAQTHLEAFMGATAAESLRSISLAHKALAMVDAVSMMVHGTGKRAKRRIELSAAAAELLSTIERLHLTPNQCLTRFTAPGADVLPLKVELDLVHKVEQLAADRAKVIYRASCDAPASEKVCDDFLAKMLGESHGGFIEYPIQVMGITHASRDPVYRARRRGENDHGWVAVRPVGDEFEGKTLLGVYVGDFALSSGCSYHRSTGVLETYIGMHNPAIWVPSLDQVILGCESWWARIKSPDDLRKITDHDISSVWYVQAFRALGGQAPLAWSDDGPDRFAREKVGDKEIEFRIRPPYGGRTTWVWEALRAHGGSQGWTVLAKGVTVGEHAARDAEQAVDAWFHASKGAIADGTYIATGLAPEAS